MKRRVKDLSGAAADFDGVGLSVMRSAGGRTLGKDIVDVSAKPKFGAACAKSRLDVALVLCLPSMEGEKLPDGAQKIMERFLQNSDFRPAAIAFTQCCRSAMRVRC